MSFSYQDICVGGGTMSFDDQRVLQFDLTGLTGSVPACGRWSSPSPVVTLPPVFSPQTLVKLNPKLQPMVDMIKANRVKWEELDKKRQHDHSAPEPPSPCGGADGSETGGKAPPTHVS